MSCLNPDISFKTEILEILSKFDICFEFKILIWRATADSTAQLSFQLVPASVLK